MPTPISTEPLALGPVPTASTTAPGITPAIAQAPAPGAPPVMSNAFRTAMSDLYTQYNKPGEEQPAQSGQMQQMQEDIWRNSMQLLPQNTGGSQLHIYGNGQVDPKTGKMGAADPAVAAARLKSVMALRPDLLWPGTNPNGTIQREFTGDRYDR